MTFEEEDAARRENVLRILLVGSIGMLACFDVLVGYYAITRGNHPGGVPFVAFSALLVFFVFLYALHKRGKSAAAAYLLIGAYFFSNSYGAYRMGLDVPTVLVSYALLIVIASILINARFGWVTAAATAAVFLPLWFFQVHTPLFQNGGNFTMGDGISLVILYGIITLVAWLSNREIEKSLLRAKNSERALKEERDSLEITVEQRTNELRAAELEKVDQLYRFAEFGQLASGLFHDLLNLVQTVSLRSESGAYEQDEFQARIDGFRDAIGKQLNHADIHESFSLVENIENACQLLSNRIQRDSIRFRFDHEKDDMFHYAGNPFNFHQVVMNLVLNAAESFESPFSGSEPGSVLRKSIAISLAREGESIIFTVTDNGCGISEYVQGKIFEPFFSTKRATKKGMGIGLAMTKRIVEQDLNGTVNVRNAEGGGTIFTVRFPVRNDPGPITNHDSMQ